MKRVLVISNACFSDSDSNGRTLAKLFKNIKRENLAQIYMYGEPDFNVCGRYYRVTDRDAMLSFIKMCEAGSDQHSSSTQTSIITTEKCKVKKNSLKNAAT